MAKVSSQKQLLPQPLEPDCIGMYKPFSFAAGGVGACHGNRFPLLLVGVYLRQAGYLWQQIVGSLLC